MKRNSADYALLEEVLKRALHEASELERRKRRGAIARKASYSYFNILECAKQQAEILGIRFQDQAIRELDPYRLIGGQRDAA